MRIAPVTNGLQVLSTSLAGTGMRFWEYKDRNMHRGIIDFEPQLPLSRTQIELEVRKKVVDAYVPSWARGFAFGTTIQFNDSPDYSLEVFSECIDGLNKNKGVWQWVIAIDHQKNSAYAAHMWMHGSLHPMFENTVSNLKELGYEVRTAYLEKPRLFKGFDAYLDFAPKAIAFLKKFQLVGVAIFVIFLMYSYFEQNF